MKKTAITNVTIIKHDKMIPQGIVIFEDDKITACGQMRQIPTPADAEIIDGTGLYCGPGLVDIHTHAGNNTFFTDDPVTAAQDHLQHGTTTVYPALYFSFDSEIDFVKSTVLTGGNFTSFERISMLSQAYTRVKASTGTINSLFRTSYEYGDMNPSSVRAAREGASAAAFMGF